MSWKRHKQQMQFKCYVLNHGTLDVASFNGHHSMKHLLHKLYTIPANWTATRNSTGFLFTLEYGGGSKVGRWVGKCSEK